MLQPRSSRGQRGHINGWCGHGRCRRGVLGILRRYSSAGGAAGRAISTARPRPSRVRASDPRTNAWRAEQRCVLPGRPSHCPGLCQMRCCPVVWRHPAPAHLVYSQPGRATHSACSNRVSFTASCHALYGLLPALNTCLMGRSTRWAPWLGRLAAWVRGAQRRGLKLMCAQHAVSPTLRDL